ncbi:MAG: AI-2E family transporter [Chitinophagaceae bacterium]|nr:AI-2E family transporter [Chitinophagaceae bacterium]
MEKYIDQNRLRQFFFILIILILGGILFWQLYFFLPALLGAVTLYVLMRKYMFYLTEKEKWRRSWSSIFLMVTSGVIILLPIGLLIEMVSTKVYYAIENSAQIIESLKKLANDLEEKVGQDFVSDANINRLGTFVTQRIPMILGATFNTVATLFFMYFLLYFMLMNGREMEEDIYEYTPLKDENLTLLRKDVQNMVVSNAIGIPVIALLQGVVGLIGYLILGVNDPWFWFVVTCITAMIPVVGAALAYVPIGIIFLANSQIWQGVVMLLYGFIIIGTVDNIFRFALQRKIGNIHPLITIFGVIIGIQLFGFIGLIFGPLLISLFMVLLKIYSNEFVVKKRQVNTSIEN